MEASKTSRLSSNLSTPATKVCTRCKQEKNIEEFKFRYKAEGIRQPSCNVCSRKGNKKHYDNNRDQYLNRAKNRKKVLSVENRQKRLDYLKEHPCVVCGEADPVVLEFDHIDRKTKRDNIAQMITQREWPVILAEIEKCQVMCANCHRRKTWRESH